MKNSKLLFFTFNQRKYVVYTLISIFLLSSYLILVLSINNPHSINDTSNGTINLDFTDLITSETGDDIIIDVDSNVSNDIDGTSGFEQIESYKNILAILFRHEGRKHLTMYDVNTKSVIYHIQGSIYDFKLTTSGSLIAVQALDGEYLIYYWQNIYQFTDFITISLNKNPAINEIVFNDKSKELYYTDQNYSLNKINLDTLNSTIDIIQLTNDYFNVDPSNRYIAYTHDNPRYLVIYDILDQTQFEIDVEFYAELLWHPVNPELVLSITQQEEIQSWDIDSKMQINKLGSGQLIDETSIIQKMDFNNNGEYLALLTHQNHWYTEENRNKIEIIHYTDLIIERVVLQINDKKTRFVDIEWMQNLLVLITISDITFIEIQSSILS
ncbi:MAG: hypothetical protein HeimC2_44720 [Candidatus Heimdallarchaeota archaeon LC_2]|nr:MAG: hypothetical protein HeimC2_44720 [Candidatus Heimdallarchaeota archaeon LC_2]